MIQQYKHILKGRKLTLLANNIFEECFCFKWDAFTKLFSTLFFIWALKIVCMSLNSREENLNVYWKLDIIIEPSHEKTNIVESGKVSTRISISMPHSLTRRHFSPPVDFLFQESLLYISTPWDGMCRPGWACADWIFNLNVIYSMHSGDGIHLFILMFSDYLAVIWPKNQMTVSKQLFDVKTIFPSVINIASLVQLLMLSKWR